MTRRNANTLVLGVIAGFILGMALVFGISRMQPTQKISDALGAADQSARLRQGSPAPNFELAALSGEAISLQDLHGKIVLINFWATWCGPCLVEMPTFQSFYEQYPQDLVILAVNSSDSPEEIAAFMDEHQLTFPALLDSDERVFRQYFVPGFPTTYLVDRAGLIENQHIGVMTATQLAKYLNDLGLEP